MLRTRALCPLCLISLRSFNPPHQLDIFGDSSLGPDTAAKSHGCDLQEDLELRCQTAVDTSCWRDPLREAFEWSVEEARADIVAGEWRRTRTRL